MTGVIYADVLFILNTYINYAILTLTALFLHVTPSRLRLLCGAVLGGACSLIILFPWAGVAARIAHLPSGADPVREAESPPPGSLEMIIDIFLFLFFCLNLRL